MAGVTRGTASRIWSVGLRQGLLALGALALCPLAAFLIGNDAGAPVARAEALIAAERRLGIFVEPAIHAWGRGHPGLLMAAGVFYVFAHVPVAGWALTWTWFLRRDRFRLVRDTFLWTQAILVVIYLLVPTAPPRLVPGTGFTDTLTGLWGHEFADSAHVLQSPFAAVPSGHVAFALIVSGVFVRMGDMAWLRAFGWVYAPLVVAVTVVTANHLLLDAATAACVVACAHRLAMGRPRTKLGPRPLAGPQTRR
jgi:fumarate reductase subunit C